jgi:outer membrane protein
MRLITTLLLATIIQQVYAQQPTTNKWDLQRCVDYAIKNNISVRQADVQARLAALQAKQAKLYQYPSASFGTNVGLQNGRSIDPTTNLFTTTQLLSQSYSLQGGAQIFNWNKVQKNIDYASFTAAAALADVERAANDASLSVCNYYLQVLAAKEQIEVTKVQIAQTSSQLEITKKQVDAGSLPELNLVEVEAQLANDSSTFIAAQTTYEQALLTLKATINLDASAAFEVVTPPIDRIPILPLADLQPEPLYVLALTTQPLQKGDSLRMKAAEKNIAVNKASMYPSLNGSYSLGTTFNNKALQYSGTTLSKYPYLNQINDNFRQSVGVGLSIPIFNNGQYKTAYEQSKLNYKTVQLNREQNNITLKNNIYTAYTNAVNSLQKSNAGRKSVGSNQKAYDFALKRYEVGLLSTIDLITNQNNLLKAKLQQISNEYDYVFKMKLLEFYRGQGLKLQ